MNTAALVFHFAYWIIAYFFWLFFTQANHPTWTLRIVCTFFLVASSAVFACRFVPKNFGKRQVGVSVLALVLIGSATALVIHVVYDSLLGPDPRRFKLITNVWMDITFVLVNAIVAGVVAWLFKIASGVGVWRIKPEL